MGNNIRFTALQAQKNPELNRSPAKAFDFKDGKLVKVPNIDGHKVVYNASVKTVDSLQEYADYLNNITHDCVNLYGVPYDVNDEHDFVVVPHLTLSNANFSNYKKTVLSRKRESFQFAPKQAGIMFIDLDGISDQKLVINQFFESIPELADYPYVIQSSSSANIYTKDGTQLKGESSAHIYFAVDDASMIPEIGEIIFSRLILNGHGEIKVAKNGAALKRSIIDAVVWQPERIDFAGGAQLLSDNLTQKRRADVIRPNSMNEIVPVSIFKKIKPAERKLIDDEWDRLKRNARPLMQSTQATFITSGKTPAENEARQSLCESNVMTGDFRIGLQNGGSVTVNEILNDPNKYHEMVIPDPVEGMEYGASVAIIYSASNPPIIYSHAHGKTVYKLSSIKVLPYDSNNPPRNNKSMARAMNSEKTYYSMDNTLYQVEDGNFSKIGYDRANTIRLTNRVLENVATFSLGVDKTGMPSNVIESIIVDPSSYFPEIKKISPIPHYDWENDKLTGQKRGYDEQSKVYFNHDMNINLHDDVTKEDVMKELSRLFGNYKYRDKKIGWAKMCAAVFTVALRGQLETAPAIMIHAPRRGQTTGKTPMGQALFKISGYPFVSINADCPAVELNKRIDAHFLSRPGSGIFLDNIQEGKQFHSDSLSSILTLSTTGIRPLSTSDITERSTAIPIIMTQNAFTTSRDLGVRIIDIALLKSGYNPKGVKLANQVNQEKLLSLILSYIRNVHQNEDLSKLTLQPSKHETDYEQLVQIPIWYLTGVDIVEQTELSGDEFGNDENAGFEKLLEDFNAKLEIDSFGIKKNAFTYKDFESIMEKELDHYCRDQRIARTTYHKTFASMAQSVKNPDGTYGEYTLKLERRGRKGNEFSITRDDPTTAIYKSNNIINFAENLTPFDRMKKNSQQRLSKLKEYIKSSMGDE